MGGLSNRQRGEKFREAATLLLNSEGVPAESRLRFTTLSEFFDAAEDAEHGDIWGTGWGLVCRNDAFHDFSGGLTLAQEVARADGKDRAALIQYRRASEARGVSIRDSFVVMTLDSFAKVLKAEQEARP